MLDAAGSTKPVPMQRFHQETLMFLRRLSTLIVSLAVTRHLNHKGKRRRGHDKVNRAVLVNYIRDAVHSFANKMIRITFDESFWLAWLDNDTSYRYCTMQVYMCDTRNCPWRIRPHPNSQSWNRNTVSCPASRPESLFECRPRGMLRLTSSCV